MWSRTGPHEWRHSNGWIIERRWAAGKFYYPCYLDAEDYDSGCNFLSAESLRQAKLLF